MGPRNRDRLLILLAFLAIIPIRAAILSFGSRAYVRSALIFVNYSDSKVIVETNDPVSEVDEFSLGPKYAAFEIEASYVIHHGMDRQVFIDSIDEKPKCVYVARDANTGQTLEPFQATYQVEIDGTSLRLLEYR